MLLAFPSRLWVRRMRFEMDENEQWRLLALINEIAMHKEDAH